LAVSAILPIAIAILTGLLVGSIPVAVDAGLGSAPGGTTLRLLAAVAVLVVTQRVLNPMIVVLDGGRVRETGNHAELYLLQSEAYQ
jgi:ATP-binding cassette subfamily B protein